MRLLTSTLPFLGSLLLSGEAGAKLVHRYSLVSCDELETNLGNSTGTADWDCNVVDGTRSLMPISAPIDYEMYNSTATAGVSFTLWATIPLSLNQSQSLVHVPSSDEACLLLGFSFNDDDGRQLMIEFIDRYGICRQVGINIMQNHIAFLTVSFSAQSMTVFLDNGEVQIDNAPQTMHSELWKRATTLEFFSDGQTDGMTLQDTIPIQQLSLYDRPLTRNQAQELWSKGVVYPKTGRLELPDAPNNVALTQKNVTQSTTVHHTLPKNTQTYPTVIQIISVPRIGILTHMDKSTALTAGLVLPWNHLTSFHYIVPPNYFNTPSINARGLNLQHEPDATLSYRLVAEKDSIGSNNNRTVDPILAVSDVFSVTFHIIHTNHAPDVVVPAHVLVQEDGTGTVKGISVLDSQDWNIDRVRVRVSVTAGRLLLPPRDPTSSDIVIVAAPDDVAWMLDGMQYLKPEQGDISKDAQVKVEVYDGVGSPCLELEDHKAFSTSLGNEYSTDHHGVCFTRTGTIPIIHAGSEAGSAGAWTIVVWTLSSVFVFFGAISCCCLFYHRRWLASDPSPLDQKTIMKI